MSKNLHVVPHDNEWAVKREGQATPLSLHSTQQEATEAAIELDEENVTGIVVHRSDGSFSKRWSLDSPHSSAWRPSPTLILGSVATVAALIAVGGFFLGRSDRRWSQLTDLTSGLSSRLSGNRPSWWPR
jgi:hypothetical protein